MRQHYMLPSSQTKSLQENDSTFAPYTVQWLQNKINIFLVKVPTFTLVVNNKLTYGWLPQILTTIHGG